MEFNQFSDEQFDESISIREVLEKYTAHIKWFIISILIFVALAVLKLRYESPKYQVNASILIKQQERGNSTSDLAAFEDIGLFGLAEISLENEMKVLKSRRLMEQVVKELKLNKRYFVEESPYDKEMYPNYPIDIKIESDSSTIDQINTSLKIKVKSKSKFELFSRKDLSLGLKEFDQVFEADMGTIEHSDKRMVRIVYNPDYKNDLIGKIIIIKINSVNGTVTEFIDKLEIEPINERYSNVLNFKIDETSKEKGVALINNLIEQYNADAIQDKNFIAQTSIDFLDKRIALMSTELNAIATTAAQYKSSKGMVNANAETANTYLRSSTAAESELAAANTQLSLVYFMLDELNKSNLTDPLSGNIGLSDNSIINRITDYNNLIMKRNRVLKSSTEMNPLITGIDSELNVIKNNLIGSLKTLRSSAQIKIDAITRERGRIGYKIASVPKHEKEFKEIVRGQETKRSLYLFLLQKREESILANAVSVEKAKIIDKAYSNGIPVSPKKMLTILGAIILGVLIPFLIIYIKDLLDTKVHDESDIKKLKIPYLGDVPKTKLKKEIFVKDGDNTNIAEAFRYIRTNVNFILDDKSMGKTILVTSTQGKEGKTFTAINLACSLAISGKKTLLLGMDLRAPKISEYLKLENKQGVTNFITNKELDINDIILKQKICSNLDLINSGDIPPNPVELLMSKRVKEIFKFAKENYEFIIVDTAPVGLVTDTMQISKYGDMTIYVVKANVLDKRMLHIPEKIHRDDKLPKMSILINGSNHSQGAYGYGYGYGYGKINKKPWYKRMF